MNKLRDEFISWEFSLFSPVSEWVVPALSVIVLWVYHRHGCLPSTNIFSSQTRVLLIIQHRTTCPSLPANTRSRVSLRVTENPSDLRGEQILPHPSPNSLVPPPTLVSSFYFWLKFKSSSTPWGFPFLPLSSLSHV